MREGANRGVSHGRSRRDLRAVCLVARSRTYRARSSRTLSRAAGPPGRIADACSKVGKQRVRTTAVIYVVAEIRSRRRQSVVAPLQEAFAVSTFYSARES